MSQSNTEKNSVRIPQEVQEGLGLDLLLCSMSQVSLTEAESDQLWSGGSREASPP